jgi:hypothetical protein
VKIKALPAKMAAKITRAPAKFLRPASRIVDETAQGTSIVLFDPCSAVHMKMGISVLSIGKCGKRSGEALAKVFDLAFYRIIEPVCGALRIVR